MITERVEYFYLSAFETEYKKRAQSCTLYQAAIIDNLFKKDLQTFRPPLTLFFHVYTCFALPHKHRRRHVGQNTYSTGCFNAQRNQLIYQHQAGKKDKQQGCVANWAK